MNKTFLLAIFSSLSINASQSFDLEKLAPNRPPKIRCVDIQHRTSQNKELSYNDGLVKKQLQLLKKYEEDGILFCFIFAPPIQFFKISILSPYLMIDHEYDTNLYFSLPKRKEKQKMQLLFTKKDFWDILLNYPKIHHFLAEKKGFNFLEKRENGNYVSMLSIHQRLFLVEKWAEKEIVNELKYMILEYAEPCILSDIDAVQLGIFNDIDAVVDAFSDEPLSGAPNELTSVNSRDLIENHPAFNEWRNDHQRQLNYLTSTIPLPVRYAQPPTPVVNNPILPSGCARPIMDYGSPDPPEPIDTSCVIL